MWNLNYEKAKEMISVLDEHGFAMSKKFGQNFLLPLSIREKIVSRMGNIEGRSIFEIGPGLGAITSVMLGKGAFVRAFEIDHGFAQILRNEAFADEERFSLVEGDALKTLFKETERPDLIVGNLPYNVGSLIIGDIIERGLLPERMVFTLQKEVVERMCAREGGKEYSSFSVLSQLDYDVSYSFTIARTAFYPQPNVDSAVVVMKKKADSVIEKGEREKFFLLLRTLFSQRRKTIKNNLGRIIQDRDQLKEVLEKAGIDEKERAENLSLKDIVRLMRCY